MLPLAIIFCSFFCLIAIYFSEKEAKLKKQLLEKKHEYDKASQEILFLKKVHARIDECFDTQHMFRVFSQSLEDFFPDATISTLVVHHGKVFFKTASKEKVSHAYIQQLKEKMLASFKELYKQALPHDIDEEKTGIIMDYTDRKEEIASYTVFPIRTDTHTIGLLSISSLNQNSDRENILPEIEEYINQTAKTIGQVQRIAAIEKRKLSSLIRSLNDGIIMFDETNTVSVINDIAKQLLHIQKDHVTTDDIAATLDKKIDLLKRINTAKETNKAIELKDIHLGDTIMDITITPVKSTANDDTNNTIGIAVLLHDVTMEKSIAKIKEDFTNAVVHELRSPLTAIKSSAAIITEDKEKLGETNMKFLKIIISQTEQMLSDISSLLDAAKIESGKLSITQKANDVEKIIMDTIDLFSPEAKRKKITLVCDIAEDLAEANCDRVRITQVLNNLVSNSLKFTAEGGTITISAKQNFTQHLPKTLINPGILISVSDTGVGIPHEKQYNLFSKFAQVHMNGIKEHHGGSGLGLYITKGIISAHGGGIYMHSEVNKGTTISFTLPTCLSSGKITEQKITARVTTAKSILESPIQVIHGLH